MLLPKRVSKLRTIMNNFLNGVKSFIFDTTFLSLIARALFSISQFSATFFVVIFFSTNQQALYFLFLSILAIQVIFELGLSQVIVIMISRSRSSSGEIDNFLNSNTVDAISFGIRKFFRITILYFITAMIIAFIVLYIDQGLKDITQWLYPWLLILFIYSLRLFLILIEAIIEGFGKIADVLQVRSFYYLLFIPVFALASYMGLQLWSFAIAWGSVIVAGFSMNFLRHGELLRLSWYKMLDAENGRSGNTSLKPAVSKFHGKVSVTWMASYAISNLPLLIAYIVSNDRLVTSLGIASQVSAIIGVLAAAISSPHIATASNRHSSGDQLGFIKQFKRTLHRTMITTALCATTCIILSLTLHHYLAETLPKSSPTSIELLPFVASALIYSYMACVGQFFRSMQEEVFNIPLAGSAVVTVIGMATTASSGNLLLLGMAQLLGPVLIILPFTLIRHQQLIAQKDYLK